MNSNLADKAQGNWAKGICAETQRYNRFFEIVSGNNPMVGMTVAVAVAVQQAMAK